MSASDRGNGRAVTPDLTPTAAAEKRDGRDNVHPLARLAHGAYSPTVLAPARERHLDALRARFPAADLTILGLQATRLAQLAAVGEWLDGKGSPIRNKRLGTTWPAADYWMRVASAFERQHERLEAQAREAGGTSPHQTLASIAAELEAGDQDGGE